MLASSQHRAHGPRQHTPAHEQAGERGWSNRVKGNGQRDQHITPKRWAGIVPGIPTPQVDDAIGCAPRRTTPGKVLALLVGIRTYSFGEWTGLQPGEYRTRIAYGLHTRCRRHLHEQIQGKSLTPADHRQQPDAPWRGTFPQEAKAPVGSIFPNSEHATQVDGAADGTEGPGEEMERMDISVQSCAEECQLLRGRTWVLVAANFVPGAFADWAAVQQMPVAFGRWHRILSKQVAQADLVTVEVASCASMVENERVIWYHNSNPFSPGGRKQRGQHIWRGMLPLCCSDGVIVLLVRENTTVLVVLVYGTWIAPLRPKRLFPRHEEEQKRNLPAGWEAPLECV